MNTVHSDHAFGRVLVAVVATLALQRDASHAAPRVRVAYLGHVSQAFDTSFPRFLAAVREHQPAFAAAATFEFSGIPDDPRQQAKAVLEALATHPDIVVAPNGNVAQAARRAGGSIPIVFSSFLDPVRYGIVTSLQRRREAVTGVWMADRLDPKRLEILRDAYPGLRSVAIIGDRSWADSVQAEATLPPEAKRLGLRLDIVLADDAAEARAAFARDGAQGHDAWCVPRSYLAVLAGPELVAQFRAWGKPSIWGSAQDFRNGAQMAYSPDSSFVWPSVAGLLARIADGEPAAGIPVMRPQKYELVVRTGRETGVAPPDIDVVRRADVVVR
jgi:putative ABC transport system substrate-binding protein